MKTSWILFLIILTYSCKDQSVSESYYPSGALKVRVTDLGNNLSIGESYYENGNLKSKGSMIGLVTHGIMTDYFDNGQTEAIYNYNMGKLNGLMKIFDRNGEIDRYLYFLNDEIFFDQFFKNGKIVKEHVIPIITEKKKSGGGCYIDISIPFNDTLDFYNYTINLVYKFSQDSTTWGYEPDEGKFRLDKSISGYRIDCDKNINNYNFIKTLSSISGRDTLAYMNIVEIDGR